jgi:hypothetical protein
MFDSVSRGVRYGNQRVTYGQLAQFSPEVADAIAKNPALEDEFIPVNLARDVYTLKRDTAESKMAKTNAEAKKIGKEANQVGKPKKVNMQYEGLYPQAKGGGRLRVNSNNSNHKTNAF